MELPIDISEIISFLGCETPQEWVDVALQNEELMLVDHAQCEKKAASTAISLMYKYVDRPDLLDRMSKLAREELVHFDQVRKIMMARGYEYVHISAARYAQGLIQLARHTEPEKLIDRLIMGAFVEARSCERFAKIAPFLDDELQKFYLSLLKSEARHFQDYLDLAQEYSDHDIQPRIDAYRECENNLILTNDEHFRFHSGIPLMS